MSDANPLPARTLPVRLRLALLLLATFLAFTPALGNDFTMDDRFVALGSGAVPGEGNPLVRELRGLPDYFGAHYWKGHADASHLYRPVTVLSFALRHAVAGDSAFVAHLLNVLLHLVAVVLVWRMLRILGTPPGAAELAALVFGLHAIHCEAVVGIVGRAELLAFCGGAGGLLLWRRARNSIGGARAAALALSALLLFLAFGAKETALAWMVFIPLFAAAEGRLPPCRTIGARLAEATALVAPALAFLALRERALAHLPADTTVNALVNPLFDLPVVARWLSAMLVWGYGLLLTLLPFDLSADYGAVVFPVVHDLGQAEAILSVLALLAFGGALAVALRWRRREPLVFLAVACFLGFSFPTSNVPFAIGTVFGERLYYTPSLGLAFLVAWLAPRLAPVLRRAAVPAVAAWLLMSTVVLVQQSLVFRDDATLFVHEADASPTSVRMQLCVAGVHVRHNELGQALAAYARAFALAPDLVRECAEARTFFAMLCRDRAAPRPLREDAAAIGRLLWPAGPGR